LKYNFIQTSCLNKKKKINNPMKIEQLGVDERQLEILAMDRE
jgi:hypothetical protein